ncbi:MAG: hypothetical protein ACXVA9_07040 [Bdellovibrionales bacterium]
MRPLLLLISLTLGSLVHASALDHDPDDLHFLCGTVTEQMGYVDTLDGKSEFTIPTFSPKDEVSGKYAGMKFNEACFQMIKNGGTLRDIEALIGKYSDSCADAVKTKPGQSTGDMIEKASGISRCTAKVMAGKGVLKGADAMGASKYCKFPAVEQPGASKGDSRK